MKQLWIGLVEAHPLKGCTVLDTGKGAFINIVTWAEDADEFARKADLVLGEENLFVVEIQNPEPVEDRRTSGGVFDEEMEDIISRAEINVDAIIWGTFYCYENNDA